MECWRTQERGSHRSKEKLKSSPSSTSNEDDKQQPKEQEYNIESEKKQEKETGERRSFQENIILFTKLRHFINNNLYSK